MYLNIIRYFQVHFLLYIIIEENSLEKIGRENLLTKIEKDDNIIKDTAKKHK